MTGFGKDENNTALNPEKLEAVAGGNGSGRKLKVIKDAALRDGPSKAFHAFSVLPAGTIIEHFKSGYADEKGGKWYRVMPSKGTTGYLPAESCKII